jgi:syntaxin 5
MGDGSPTKAFDPKGKSRASQNGDVLALDLDAAEEGVGSSNGGAFMQMQLVEQQVRLGSSFSSSGCLPRPT